MRLSTFFQHRYWTLQVGGWFVYVLLSVTIYSTFNIRLFSCFSAFEIAVVEMGVMGILLMMSHLTHLISKGKGWVELSIKEIMAQVLITHMMTTLVSQVLIWGLLLLLTKSYNNLPPLFWGFILQVEAGMVLWVILYIGLRFVDKSRQATMMKWKLAAAATDAAISTLQAHLNPHILFNNMNNIKSLILVDPLKSRIMLAHLADVLHYPIQSNHINLVPLAQELKIIESYLELEAIQLEERLTYTIDVDKLAMEALIPPMTLQLLVENAIKHGIAPCQTGGRISLVIRCNLINRELQITVSNTGQLRTTSAKESSSLHNMHERLQLLFGSRATFTLIDNVEAPNSVTASMQFPLTLQLES